MKTIESEIRALERIIEALTKGIERIVTIVGPKSIYKLNHAKFGIEITIDPERWIGLVLTTSSPEHIRKIDTDLYPLDGKYTKHTFSVLKDMQELLLGIEDGSYMVGSVNKRIVIEEYLNKFYIHKQGLLFTSSR